MRTEQLTVGYVRLYAPDAIPLWALSSKYAVAHIGKAFGFEQFHLAEADDKSLPPGLMFGRGRAPATAPVETATIERLLIGYNQVDLTVRHLDGHSFSDVIIEELGRVCDEVVPKHSAWLAAHRVELLQSLWVGQLDLAPEDLIDTRALDVLFPALATPSAQAARKPQSRGINFRIDTRASRPDLLELGFEVPNEEFKLEPRIGRLAEDRIWFSACARRSEEHLKILESLERAYRS